MKVYSVLLQEQTFLQQVEWLAEVDSTNSYCQRNLHLASRLPLLVGADRQTRGRGRNQNSWFSAEGSLMFSLVFAPAEYQIAKSEWPQLSLVMGMSLASAIEELQDAHPAQLKWPNDVYLAGRKVCGILIESVAGRADALIVGVGLNVNTQFIDASPDVRQRATSLLTVSGTAFDLTSTLVTLLNHIETTLTQRDNRQQWLQEYRQRCFLNGKSIQVRNQQSVVKGICLGIDDEGALRVKTSAGETRCLAGSVEIV